MWFPKRGPLGNCVPEWALRVGCSFRERPVAETVSQNPALKTGRSFRKEVLGKTVPRFDPKYWDIASLS